MFFNFVTGNKRQRTGDTTSDQSVEDIPSSKRNSTDKQVSLDNDSKPSHNISSRCSKDPARGKSHRRKLMPQKPIAEKQFLNTNHKNVDCYAKEKPRKRTNLLPPLSKEKKLKGSFDIS